jgi:hypothetical protein
LPIRCIMQSRWQNGQFPSCGAGMTGVRPYYRLIWFVFVAIGVVLSIVGDASASVSAAGRANRAGGCCVKPVCSSCCCESVGSTTRPEPTERSGVLAAVAVSFSSPSRSCECRSSEQPASTARLESRPEGSRPDSDRREPIVATLFDASPAFTWLVREPDIPSGSPLYLRNERLLI